MSEKGSVWLSPSACGKRIGMSDDFILGEIRDGRLPARKKQYQSGRARYRVDQADFERYLSDIWRPVSPAA